MKHHEYCEEAIDKTEDKWYSWRSLAGYIYLLICIFDFVLMPALVHSNHLDTKAVIVDLINAKTYVPDALDSLAAVDRINSEVWMPLTLVGGGLFHISFGAILTGVAVTRGAERKEIVKNGAEYKNKPEQ